MTIKVRVTSSSRVFEPEGRTFHVGDEVELEDRAALELIASGSAERIDQEEAAVEAGDEPDDTIDAGDESVNATAAAEALAVELKVDLATISGTGKDGLITKADVAAAAKAKE